MSVHAWELSFYGERSNGLLHCGRTESLKNFKVRFSAAVTKFNFLSETTKIIEGITALMLLSNSGIEQSQKVSFLAAAAPANLSLSKLCSKNDFLKAVTYHQLVSVVKQCERASSS